MTTGRINQVATVAGVRPTCRSVGRSASSHVRRSPHGRGARVALARRLNGTRVRTTEAPGRAARIGRSRRGSPDRGRQFLSPSRHPLRGRNTQDGQARNEPIRVAHRSDLDRNRQLNGSQPTRRLPDRWHAGPGRSRASSRLPRLAAELVDRMRTEFAVARRRPNTQDPTDANASARRPSSPCRVRTLHCRFTYKAAHGEAGSMHPELRRLQAMRWLPTANRASILSSAQCLRLPVCLYACV